MDDGGGRVLGFPETDLAYDNSESLVLNLKLGSRVAKGDRICIMTLPSAAGHAIYGPYQFLPAGNYEVEFNIAAADWQHFDVDKVCAVVDVASSHGRFILASQNVLLSQLRDGPLALRLAFVVARPGVLEFRVAVNGIASLLIEDVPPISSAFAPHELPPDQYISKVFENRPAIALYEAMFGGSEPLRDTPARLGLGSTLCRQLHFALDEFRYWMKAMRLPAILHRKYWEYFYIAQCLHDAGMLTPGKKGLGFAVGREPLPALFASFGCEILVTDQDPERAARSGWANSNQYSQQVDTLFKDGVCDREKFFSLVRYRSVDMNSIPDDLNEGFDFCWSSCSLEHLGSLQHGIQFVENAMDTLRAGGMAVHTTEFNLSSNNETFESEATSIYRRRDMEEMGARLEGRGYQVLPFDWTLGQGFAETVIDLPPYKQIPHLRLWAQEFDCTSVAIAIRKPSCMKASSPAAA